MLEPDPALDGVTPVPAADLPAAAPGSTPTAGPAQPFTGIERRSTEDRRASASNRQLWMNQKSVDLEFERMHHGVPIQCQFCVGQNFRRSRLRGSDVRQLLLMRYPVRCIRCSQRQNVSFTVAGISMPSYLRQRDRPPRSSRESSRLPDAEPSSADQRPPASRP